MEQLELRLQPVNFESTNEGLKVSGYVNKTNQWSQELGVRKKFVERILPGTFEKAISRGNEINFLAEHDNAKILSSTRNGSLSLREDENGLYMEATIAPTSWGKDYHTLIKEGIIQNMSFGMKVLRDSWKKLSNGTYERSIDDLMLAEVSAVRNPAYVQSTIQARSIEIIKDVEIPAEVEVEIREDENQMENITLEQRDKLTEVLDELLVTLKSQSNQPEPQAQQVEKEQVEAKQEVAVEEKQEAKEKPAEVVQEQPTQPQKEVEKTPEVEKEPEVKQPENVEPPKPIEKPAEKVVEKEPEKPAEKPNLSEYYKKMLDF